MEGSDENGKWLPSLRPAVLDRQGFMVHEDGKIGGTTDLQPVSHLTGCKMQLLLCPLTEL